jgi:hypothetical protein
MGALNQVAIQMRGMTGAGMNWRVRIGESCLTLLSNDFLNLLKNYRIN